MDRTSIHSIGRAFAIAAVFLTPAAAMAGNGLYFGLEGGANFVPREQFRVYNFDAPFFPVADGTQVSNIGFDTGYLGGLTFGYAFSAGPRLELELAHRHNKFDSFELANGVDSERVRGKQNTDVALTNLWFDLFKSGWVHPYLGGGVGVARVDLRNIGVDSGRFFDGDALSNDFDLVFAYQAGGGLRFDIGQHWSASLDYRFLRASTGNFNLLENNPNSHVESRSTSHSALFSLHYYFSAPPKPAPESAAEPVQVVPVEEVPPAEPPAEAPPPPLPCEPPQAGQPMSLDGCKAGDVIVLRGVNFLFNKATLTVNAKTLLDVVVTALSQHADVKVAVLGHTDSKGTDSYNQKLSERRAASVKQYFESHGITADRVTAEGLGESMPIADNGTDEGRELNRRVELKITEGGGGAVTAAPPAGVEESPAPAAEAAPPADAPAEAAPAETPPADAPAEAAPAETPPADAPAEAPPADAPAEATETPPAQ